MKKLLIILTLFNLLYNTSFAQDCRLPDCSKVVKNHTLYIQPKTTATDLNKTITYNIPFDGGRDYIITFCSDSIYGPIHYRVIKSETGEEIYNNAIGNYFESIGMRVYYTHNIIIKVTLLADNLTKKEKRETGKVCIGLIINSQKTLPTDL